MVVAHSQPGPMTEQEIECSGSSHHPGSNNAFHPGRYFCTSQSYPQRRRPDRQRFSPSSLVGASLENIHRPKVVTIVRYGVKPRRNIKMLLSRRAGLSYEALITDISETFGAKLQNNKVGKLFTVSGKEVQGLSDFFRGDDHFVAFGEGESILSENEIADILKDIYSDFSVAKSLLLEWKKNEKRRRKINPLNQFMRTKKDNHAQCQASQRNPRQAQDKRDSGFHSPEVITNRSDRDQVETRDILKLETDLHTEIRGRETEHGMRNDNDNHPDQRYNYHQQEYLLTQMDKARLTAPQKENETVKSKQQNITAKGKRVKGDEKRKKNLVPLKNTDNLLRKADLNVNEVEEEILMKKVMRKKKEEIEKVQTDIYDDASEVTARVVQVVIGEDDKHQEEMNKRCNEDTEKVEESKKTYDKEEAANGKTEKSPQEPGEGEETCTKVTCAITHDVTTERTNVVSTETVLTGNAHTAAFSATTIKFTQADDKDNCQQQKEKRKQDREDQQQRKRAKTKIVQKSKFERQVSSNDYVLARYQMGRKLGDGNFAVVRQCCNKETGHEFAIKIIDKAKLKGKNHMVENEIGILKDCCHRNIVRLYEEFETADHIYLVMELVKGGDLFDAITQNVKFGESVSALMVKDLCNALFYLHSRCIVHRDLKPENLLVHRREDGSISLKLADFGLATEIKELIYSLCGTPTYVAPEILSDTGYGLEVDMWAVGVITYILLCGFPPFRSPDRNQTELFQFIKAGDFEFLSPSWDNISTRTVVLKY